MGNKCGAHKKPYIKNNNATSTIEHEATTSKINEDQFIEEFLPQVVCSNANCEVVDKSGNTKGYLTQKELSKALAKEHLKEAVKTN